MVLQLGASWCVLSDDCDEEIVEVMRDGLGTERYYEVKEHTSRVTK